MNIAIRVDSSNIIGSGHIMRCLTLAKELEKHHARILFICKEHPDHLSQILKGQGYAVKLLEASTSETMPYAHSSWLAGDEADDAKQTSAAIQDYYNDPADITIVDHYGIGKRWEETIRERNGKLVVIDDLSDRPHHCDLLLDQTYDKSPQSYDGLVNQSCRLLLGARYILLREEFNQYSSKQIVLARKNVDFHAINVLVMMGGTDPQNLTVEITRSLLSLTYIKKISIILSSQAPHLQSVIALFTDIDRVTIYVAPDNIADLMLENNLAVGAAGGSTWERCRMGLPTLTIISADNQNEIGYKLAKENVLELLSSPIEKNDFTEKLQRFMTRNNYLKKTEASLAISDGKGCQSVTKEILSLLKGIRIRRADIVDTDSLFDLANTPIVRKNSFSPDPIHYETHKGWLEKKLADKNCLILIAENDSQQLVGQIRFDVNAFSIAAVDIHISQNHSGKGIGSMILTMGVAQLKTLKLARKVKALVKVDNIASKKCFERSGFTQGDSIEHQGVECFSFSLDI
mgnify:CR=1 FL=1